jgi:hypothetical protein
MRKDEDEEEGKALEGQVRPEDVTEGSAIPVPVVGESWKIQHPSGWLMQGFSEIEGDAL